MIAQWVELFTRAIDDAFAGRPKVAAMATADGSGRPRNRSIVVRKVEPGGFLWLCSDSRSEKNEQIRESPWAEVVFWLEGRREQWRLAGGVEVIGQESTDPRRSALWAELSDGARALFSWPMPGGLRSEPDEAFPNALPAETPIPESFQLLIVRPDRVERLSLRDHPHQRTRWEAESGWQTREINP